MFAVTWNGLGRSERSRRPALGRRLVAIRIVSAAHWSLATGAPQFWRSPENIIKFGFEQWGKRKWKKWKHCLGQGWYFQLVCNFILLDCKWEEIFIKVHIINCIWKSQPFRFFYSHGIRYKTVQRSQQNFNFNSNKKISTLLHHRYVSDSVRLIEKRKEALIIKTSETRKEYENSFDSIPAHHHSANHISNPNEQKKNTKKKNISKDERIFIPQITPGRQKTYRSAFELISCY